MVPNTSDEASAGGEVRGLISWEAGEFQQDTGFFHLPLLFSEQRCSLFHLVSPLQKPLKAPGSQALAVPSGSRRLSLQEVES